MARYTHNEVHIVQLHTQSGTDIGTESHVCTQVQTVRNTYRYQDSGKHSARNCESVTHTVRCTFNQVQSNLNTQSGTQPGTASQSHIQSGTVKLTQHTV